MDNCSEILSLREKLAAMIEAKNLVQCEVARLVKERDEAREAARFFRDVYVSQVGRTYPEEYSLPWEAEK